MVRIYSRLINNIFFILMHFIFWDKLPQIVRTKFKQYRKEFILTSARELDFYKFAISNNLDDFPFTSKTILKQNRERICREERASYGFKYTSGSSGVPFQIPKWKYSDLIEFVVGERAFYRVMGFKLRPRVLVLRSFSPKRGEKITKYSFLRNWYYFSPYHINKENLKTLLAYYRHVRPKILKGYPSTIYSFTLLLINNEIKEESPELIFTSSETFPSGWREIIENYWDCPVIDWYGQNERTVIVTQCEFGNYHTNDDYGILEIDADSNEIIATSLWNDIMPFIKYRTGDIAIPLNSIVNCQCCNKGPVQIAGIVGRTDDMLVDGNRNQIPPTNFYSLFEKFSLKGFQIVQKKDLSIDVLVIGWEDLDIDEKRIIQDELNERVKGQILNIIGVQEIERNTVTNKIKIIKRET